MLSDRSNDFSSLTNDRRKQVYIRFFKQSVKIRRYKTKCVTHFFFFFRVRVFVCLIEYILYMHIFLHMLQLSIVAYQEGKYFGLASFLQYSHYYSFILFLSRCICIVLLLQKGLLHWWVFTKITFGRYVLSISLALFFPPSCSSLLSMLSLLLYKKKKKSGAKTANERTNEYRKSVCLLFSLYSIISQNNIPVIFTRLIYTAYSDIFIRTDTYLVFYILFIIFSGSDFDQKSSFTVDQHSHTHTR